MDRLTLPFLETMITQVCNLSCQGCTNYSDLKHSGYVSWEQGRTWLEPWTELLDIPDFGIMGGEPLINPEVVQWIVGVRELLPDTQIRFTTNGLLLHKYPDLLKVLQDIGNCVFKISVHLEDKDLENTIQNIFAQYSWQEVTEYGISRWKTNRGLRLQINRPTQFLKTFHGKYSDMQPHHSKPLDAFDLCVQKTCPLLYKESIYKCSTSALLLDTLDRFDRPNWNQWKSFIEQGITVNSPYKDIQAFVDNFGKPHQRCGQCPDSRSHPLMHFATVTRK
jgi:sulfatase maturation enzyme AslB (radical SAM superfamily)